MAEEILAIKPLQLLNLCAGDMHIRGELGAAARLSYPGLPFIFVLLTSAFDQEYILTKVRTIQIAALLGFVFNIIIVFEANSALLPDIITLAGGERRAARISARQLVLNRPVITLAGIENDRPSNQPFALQRYS
jgi:hypothetical protein